MTTVEQHTCRFHGGPNSGKVVTISAPAGAGAPLAIQVSLPTGAVGWYDESPVARGVYVWREV